MLVSDLRFAIRSLRQAPGFSVLAIPVLAVGIGATGAIFNLIDGTLIRPLPFADPDRLVMLWEHPPSDARNRVSPLNFLDWSEQNHGFAAMAAVAGSGRTLTGAAGVAERIPGQSRSSLASPRRSAPCGSTPRSRSARSDVRRGRPAGATASASS